MPPAVVPRGFEKGWKRETAIRGRLKEKATEKTQGSGEDDSYHRAPRGIPIPKICRRKRSAGREPKEETKRRMTEN